MLSKNGCLAVLTGAKQAQKAQIGLKTLLKCGFGEINPICFLADIGHRSRQQPVSRVREDELRRRERHRVGEGIQTLDHLSGFKNHPSRLGNNCVS